MKELRLIALTLCVSLIAACQTVDGFIEDIDSLQLPALSQTENQTRELIYEGKCPRVEAVEDLSAISEFSNLADPSQYNLISSAHIAKVETACSYNERAVTVDLKMVFEGNLGPHGRTSPSNKPYFSYPFFVAVTSPGGEILAKEVFAASMTYEAGSNRQTYHESMRQIIPVESQDRGARYKILVGFQLNPDQLAFNRKNLKTEKLIEEAAEIQPTMLETTTQEAAQQSVQTLPRRGNPIDITGQQ